MMVGCHVRTAIAQASMLIRTDILRHCAKMQSRRDRGRLGREDDGGGLLGGQLAFQAALGQGANGSFGVDG